MYDTQNKNENIYKRCYHENVKLPMIQIVFTNIQRNLKKKTFLNQSAYQGRECFEIYDEI